MSLKLEIQEILNQLSKYEANSNAKGEGSDNIFGGLKVQQKTFPSAKLVFDKQNFRRYFARPYNFLHVVKFLDLSSLLNLGTVNKEFYAFLSSIQLFKIIQTRKSKRLKTETSIGSLSPKSVSSKASNHSSKSFDSAIKKKNIVNGFLKGVGNFFFGGSKDTKKQITANEINMRVTLHEEVLNKIKKRFEIQNEIKALHEEIDSIMTAKNNPNDLKKKVSNKENDKEYLSINRDLIIKEHNELEAEVTAMKKEIEKLKRKVDYYEMNDLEKAKSLLSIKSYLDNNLKLDSIKLIQEDELRSGKFSNLYDFDVSAIAYYDDFLKQNSNQD